MDLGRLNCFGKQHEYNTQADLVNMSPEDIVRLEPCDVPSYIIDRPGSRPLDNMQLKALRVLLQIKQDEKAMRPPINKTGRDTRINKFLGIDDQTREVSSLLKETMDDMAKEDSETAIRLLQEKDLRNRLAKLNGLKLVPYTDADNITRRFMEVNKGGKRRKTYKRKRRVTKKRKDKRKSSRKRRKV
jgi:hypothetical protein